MINQVNNKGQKHGYWRYISPITKKLLYIGYYVNDLRDGYWEWFRSSGYKIWIGNYLKGEIIGYWETFDEYGKLTEKKFHL